MFRPDVDVMRNGSGAHVDNLDRVGSALRGFHRKPSGDLGTYLHLGSLPGFTGVYGDVQHTMKYLVSPLAARHGWKTYADRVLTPRLYLPAWLKHVMHAGYSVHRGQYTLCGG